MTNDKSLSADGRRPLFVIFHLSSRKSEAQPAFDRRQRLQALRSLRVDAAQLTVISLPLLSPEPQNNPRIDYSVVIPFYNEETNVKPVLEELRPVLEKEGGTFEMVLVNDGSTDNTLDQLKVCIRDWSNARIIDLVQNSGQGAALMIGVKNSRGQKIILLDGDGQNDPADIPKALQLLARFDFVLGHRVHRLDDLKRRIMSQFANFVRRLFTNDGVSDTGCGLKAFDRQVIEAFIPIQTLYSFMPALAKAAGFSIAEFPVNHRPRRSGVAKYNLRVFLWRPALDLLGVCWFSHRRSRRVQARQISAESVEANR